MPDHDHYFRQRMESELEAAQRADDASVAEIHRALAERYRQMIEDGGDQVAQPIPA